MSDERPPDVIELQRRFASEMQQVDWDALLSHHERGALFVVSPALPLVKAALSVALDLVDDVRGWLESGELQKVSDDQAEQWQTQADLQLTFLIVQPYVLVTEAPPPVLH